MFSFINFIAGRFPHYKGTKVGDAQTEYAAEIPIIKWHSKAGIL